MTAKIPVEIRPLAADDHPAWRELWTGYLEFYEAAVSEDVYRSTFARLLGEEPYDPTCLLAVSEGRPVGLVHYLFHRHCWRVENTCYLQDLYVEPGLRGTGA
ncbi:MAG: GNAT family N-acetyltransferase, partial [Pseudomonadota bacterium]